MADVFDVAAFLLAKGGPMAAMKLQKLVYYGQGWSLAIRGRPLFAERMQAWAFGPVVYELFDQHRRKFVVGSLDRGDIARLDEQEKALLEGVWSYYGKFDGVQLSQMTHEEAPWAEARRGTLPNAASAQEISNESMRAYFRTQVVPFGWTGGGHAVDP